MQFDLRPLDGHAADGDEARRRRRVIDDAELDLRQRRRSPGEAGQDADRVRVLLGREQLRRGRRGTAASAARLRGKSTASRSPAASAPVRASTSVVRLMPIERAELVDREAEPDRDRREAQHAEQQQRVAARSRRACAWSAVRRRRARTCLARPAQGRRHAVGGPRSYCSEPAPCDDRAVDGEPDAGRRAQPEPADVDDPEVRAPSSRPSALHNASHADARTVERHRERTEVQRQLDADAQRESGAAIRRHRTQIARERVDADRTERLADRRRA